jgi:hypothetical protein
MNKSTLKNTGLKVSLVQSLYFSTSLTKNTIDEYISILMSEIGVNVFGYNRQKDEYWGTLKIKKINKKDNIHFTMFINKSNYDNTLVTICIFNTTRQESNQVSLKIGETLHVFENSQSIYKKKYNL